MPRKQERTSLIITLLWLVSFVCLASAFNRHEPSMATVKNDRIANQSYADAGPCGTASRRNIRLSGNTTLPSAQNEDLRRGFTIHMGVTYPTAGGGAIGVRQAPYPWVLLINGFQATSPF